MLLLLLLPLLLMVVVVVVPVCDQLLQLFAALISEARASIQQQAVSNRSAARSVCYYTVSFSMQSARTNGGWHEPAIDVQRPSINSFIASQSSTHRRFYWLQ